MNHVVIIPGFGMCGTDIGHIQGDFHVHRLTPNWASGSLETVAKKIAREISDLDIDLSRLTPHSRLIIYGFSVGADILMEIINNGTLVVRPSTILIFADPNINQNTCFVTRIAHASADFQEFRNAVTAHPDLGVGTIDRRDWGSYLDWLQVNGADNCWTAHQNIAGTIFQSADTRFGDFYRSLNPQTGLRRKGNQQAVIILSRGNSRTQFHKAYRGAARHWVRDWDAEHFRLIEADEIVRVIDFALNPAGWA